MHATEDFLPPRPPVAARFSGLAHLLRTSVSDILSLFPEAGFRHRLMPLRTLKRRVLVVNDPELVSRVFITGKADYEAKSRHFQQALSPVIGDSMFLNGGPVWAARRAVIGKLLHPSRTADFHGIFVEGAEDLAARWRGGVDVAPGLASATALAVMRALFGPAAIPEEATRLALSFSAYEGSVLAVDVAHVLGLPDHLAGWQLRTARRHARDVRAVCAAAVRRAQRDPQGLFAELHAATAPDGSPLMNEVQLINEVAMMLLAGSETSANVLTWVLYLVARHAPTREKLREEHARVLGGRAPAAGELGALPFTRAVVQEAMRLYPPVPYLSRQAAVADRIGAIQVHPGDTVMAMPWLLHRHEHLWEAPHAFRPERFLADAPRKPPRFGYLPFSLGPRVCAGASFAMAEMMVFVAVLLQRLEFTVPEGCNPMPRARLSLRPKGGMPLVATPRDEGSFGALLDAQLERDPA